MPIIMFFVRFLWLTFLPSIFKFVINLFKKSFWFLPIFWTALLTKADKFLNNTDFWKILNLLVSIILIGFWFTFIWYIFYYLFSFSLVFIDTFFLIFRVLGYHNIIMALFLVLLFWFVIISLFKFFKSFFS